MRRILLVLTVGALMAAVVVATALPAFARATVVKNDPEQFRCFLDGVDTSNNCTYVKSDSGNELVVNRNPDSSFGETRDNAFVNHDPGCIIDGETCDKAHFTGTPSGKDTHIAHERPPAEE